MPAPPPARTSLYRSRWTWAAAGAAVAAAVLVPIALADGDGGNERVVRPPVATVELKTRSPPWRWR
jgi:hypothetical protein